MAKRTLAEFQVIGVLDAISMRSTMATGFLVNSLKRMVLSDSIRRIRSPADSFFLFFLKRDDTIQSSNQETTTTTTKSRGKCEASDSRKPSATFCARKVGGEWRGNGVTRSPGRMAASGSSVGLSPANGLQRIDDKTDSYILI